MMAPWPELKTLNQLAQTPPAVTPAFPLAPAFMGPGANETAADESWLGAEAWVDPTSLCPGG